MGNADNKAVPASETKSKFGNFSMKQNTSESQAVPSRGGFSSFKNGIRNNTFDPQDPKLRSQSIYQMAVQKQQPSAAPDFQQQLPTKEYLATKRQSVFQRVNLADLQQIKIQEIPKTEE